MGVYRTAQICLNGHCITESLETSQNLAAPRCDKCGVETISECPSCSSKIRGYYHVDSFVSFGGNYDPPKYCYQCGKPFPWTEQGVESAKQIIELDEQLSQSEKEDFKSALPDLISETPKTSVATLKAKKYTKKFGTSTAMAFRKFVIDWTCEFVKESLKG